MKTAVKIWVAIVCLLVAIPVLVPVFQITYDLKYTGQEYKVSSFTHYSRRSFLLMPPSGPQPDDLRYGQDARAEEFSARIDVKRIGIETAAMLGISLASGILLLGGYQLSTIIREKWQIAALERRIKICQLKTQVEQLDKQAS